MSKNRLQEGLFMTLQFPRRNDVKLGRAPLTQVICQVRFSPILRIGAEQPASFQEAIRSQFPIFEVEQSFSFQVPVHAQPDATPSFQMAPNAFRFTSADGHSSVTLAQDFFALATDRYTVWEDFANHLELVSETIKEEYSPAPILRVGLRYVNELDPERLGLAALEDVLALLRPELTSSFRTDAWSIPKSFTTQMELDDDGDTLAIRLGLPPFSSESSRALVLDFDYYNETTSTLDDLIPRCKRFHDVIYDAFRWAVAEDKLSVFDPIS